MSNLSPQPPEPAPPNLAERFKPIIETLRRMSTNRWLAAPLVFFLYNYLGRVSRRFESLVTRLRAGPVLIRTARTRPARTQTERRLRLPNRFGWLLKMLRHEAAAIGSQIRHILADPEFAAFLTSAPQATRILRPLCRMLGIEPAPDLPAALFPPPAIRSPRPRRVARSGRPRRLTGLARAGSPDIRPAEQNQLATNPRHVLPSPGTSWNLAAAKPTALSGSGWSFGPARGKRAKGRLGTCWS